MAENKIYDVIVVGAGASGLACAHELIKHGYDVLILEGRSRIGGRAFTIHRIGSQEPIELGAEFIHGHPKSTLDFLSAYNLSFYDVKEARHFFQNSKLKSIPEFFDQISKLMNRLTPSPKKDRSIEQFLDNQKDIPLAWRKLFRGFVEGFHGANLSVLGENGLLAAEESDEDQLNGSNLFRPTYGYDKLLEALSHLLLEKNALRFNQSVQEINWKKGQVEVKCRTYLGSHAETFYSRRLVMTASVGILKAEAGQESAMNWNPKPKGLDLLYDCIEMGHVQKIVFNFRSRFWESLLKDPIGFVHLGPEKFFPTWWNLLPLRTTQLTAWQGGPKAQEMSLWSLEERVQVALQTLSEWSGKSLSYLRSELHSYDTHNWSRDSFSLGAYSYVKVGGVEAAERWFKPLQETLFFAGEATCTRSNRATIHGAFESGSRAAQEILKSQIETAPSKTKQPTRRSMKSRAAGKTSLSNSLT